MLFRKLLPLFSGKASGALPRPKDLYQSTDEASTRASSTADRAPTSVGSDVSWEQFPELGTDSTSESIFLSSEEICSSISLSSTSLFTDPVIARDGNVYERQKLVKKTKRVKEQNARLRKESGYMPYFRVTLSAKCPLNEQEELDLTELILIGSVKGMLRVAKTHLLNPDRRTPLTDFLMKKAPNLFRIEGENLITIPMLYGAYLHRAARWHFPRWTDFCPATSRYRQVREWNLEKWENWSIQQVKKLRKEGCFNSPLEQRLIRDGVDVDEIEISSMSFAGIDDIRRESSVSDFLDALWDENGKAFDGIPLQWTSEERSFALRELIQDWLCIEEKFAKAVKTIKIIVDLRAQNIRWTDHNRVQFDNFADDAVTKIGVTLKNNGDRLFCKEVVEFLIEWGAVRLRSGKSRIGAEIARVASKVRDGLWKCLDEVLATEDIGRWPVESVDQLLRVLLALGEDRGILSRDLHQWFGQDSGKFQKLLALWLYVSSRLSVDAFNVVAPAVRLAFEDMSFRMLPKNVTEAAKDVFLEDPLLDHPRYHPPMLWELGSLDARHGFSKAIEKILRGIEESGALHDTRTRTAAIDMLTELVGALGEAEGLVRSHGFDGELFNGSLRRVKKLQNLNQIGADGRSDLRSSLEEEEELIVSV